MPQKTLLISAACLVFLFGCAARQQSDAPPRAAAPAQPAAAKAEPAPADTRTDGRKVRSTDGRVNGEIFGTPAPGSKFAQLEIGMSRTRVEKLIGTPDDSETHITGRQFQPFYFGGDTQRYEAYYKGEGQLTYYNSSMRVAPETLLIIRVDTRATAILRRR